MRELACEQGYQAVSATALIGRARVSSKTFYENFTGTHDCFIAAYDEAMAQIEAAMRGAYMRPGPWAGRIRAALEALLELLEADRQLGRLVFLEAPKARELLGGRRRRILEILQLVLDSGRSGEHARATPVLIDELLVEGSLAVIRTRLASTEQDALAGLADELMGVITYVYTGQKGAIVSPPQLTPGQLVASPAAQQPAEQAGAIRMTYRTLRVLNALAENPGACNRQIAEAAGISDAGTDLKAAAPPVRPSAGPQRRRDPKRSAQALAADRPRRDPATPRAGRPAPTRLESPLRARELPV